MTTASSPAAPESFAALFEESLALKEMRIGEVITAEVIRVDANHVVVNAGLKSESYILTEEFLNDRGEIEVKPGDFVKVAIDALEDGFGETRLSRDKAKRLAAWMDLEEALRAGADVVVCGGGHGMLSKTLLAGVPAVVVPGGGDQWELANRIVRQGSARLVRPLSADTLIAGVTEVLLNPGYRQAARRAGDSIVRVADPVAICRSAMCAR